MWSALGAAFAAGAITAAAPGSAEAQSIATNRYQLDFFQGASLAPIRVIGIGGAYAGVAEGISGFVANASSPALRDPSSSKWIELDAAVSMSLPLVLFERSDFDNSGRIDQSYTDFIYLAAGGLLQLGPFGAGFIADAQRYTLRSGGVRTDVNIARAHVLGAWSFFGGQFMLGGGVRIGGMLLQTPDAELTMLGLAPEAGFLIRPDWKSFRIGATFRMPVEAGELGSPQLKIENGLRKAGGLVLPERVVWPWELEVGIAVQVGPRPFNPQWINPHDQEAQFRAVQDLERRRREAARSMELSSIADASERRLRAKEHEEARAREAKDDEKAFEKAVRALQKEQQARYANWPREMLLVTAELLVTGNVDRGVGLEGFLGQNAAGGAPPGGLVGSSGRDINFSPRFGIETEPIPGLVHTRFGSYYEPRRLRPNEEQQGALGVGRQHFTFGADLRVLTTTFWGLVPEITYTLQASVDIAPRYESFSVGIGNWK
ncbi:MAG: hypothetical protein IPK82_28720 [Polyangiaceae bacterium]|nr:hypothetical protein [Polyangiaceae bacterium]